MLVAVLLAWALVGEAPLPVQAVGMVLVVAGIALVRRGTDTVEVVEALEAPRAVADARV